MKSYFQHLIDEIILDYPLCWARRYSKWKFIYQLTFNVPVIYLLFEYYAIFSYATFNATLFSRFFIQNVRPSESKWAVIDWQILDQLDRPRNEEKLWPRKRGQRYVCTYSWNDHVIVFQKYHFKHFEIASVRN